MLANAIDVARVNLSRGDVLLLEAQTWGWNCPDRECYVPVEWEPAVYDAIVRATAAGIIVVEAGGNGNQNLDDPYYGSPFPRGRADSGAIIVGAGGAPGCSVYPQPARSRLELSSYGSRIDVQGWGECVTTSGYGNLHNGGSEDSWYTHSFSGTSSASPIVAAAAASLSSAYETAIGGNLSPQDVRRILVTTGAPQELSAAGAIAGKVGPLPNLRAALARILDTRPPVVRALTSSGKKGTLVGLRFQVSDDGGRTRELIQVYGGGKLVKTILTSTTESRPGVVYSFKWRVPRTIRGAVRFCVRAWTRPGTRA